MCSLETLYIKKTRFGAVPCDKHCAQYVRMALGGLAPHLFEGLPGPPGPARFQNSTPPNTGQTAFRARHREGDGHQVWFTHVQGPAMKTIMYHLLPTTYYLLPTTYYLLPTTYFLLPTTYYLVPMTYYRYYYLSLTTYCLFPITCYLRPITYYLVYDLLYKFY